MPPKFKRGYETVGGAERTALLDDQSGDEDDFFMKGPTAQPSRLMEDGRLSRIQGQVSEVVGVMQNNISKVMERGDRLEDLSIKSDELSSHSDMFRSNASTLRKQMWWKECKMRIFLAVIIVVILLIIIVPIIIKHKK